MENPERVTESLTTLPVEYWETESSIYGALSDNLRADGAFILSARDMAIGSKLNARIFYANEYKLDSITVAANIVSKDHNIAEDWNGYKYQLQFVQISEEDRLKLRDLLNNHSKLEHIPGVQDRIPDGSSLREAVLPPVPNVELTALSSANCTSYENGRCLKTRAFCDICKTADETILSERARSAKKARSHQSSPFTSALAKLAGNFKSAVRNH